MTKLLNLMLLFIAAAYITLVINPFGLGQIIFWGMRPPYHWTMGDMTRNSAGSISETYIDSHGKECAKVFRYVTQDDKFKVYGFGFSDYYETRAAAEARAERECR